MKFFETIGKKLNPDGLDGEMRKLLSKDWSQELKQLGLEGRKLQSAVDLMKSFCKGVVDTIKHQQTRSLVASNYQIPQIVIAKILNDAQYVTNAHRIEVSWSSINFSSQYRGNSKVDIKQDNSEHLLYQVSLEDYFYLSGVEEAKHSIDFTTGRISADIKPSENTPSLEYYLQKHEFAALIEKLRLLKKRNPNSDAYRSLHNFMKQVATSRRDSSDMKT